MCNNPVLLKEIQSKFYKNAQKYHSVNFLYGKNLIPCGNCLGCRVDKLTLWTARCNYELFKGHSAFVTFTYDDYHLPYNDGSLYPTLVKNDLQKYIDNLRHKVKELSILPQGNRKDFAYFCCGEYGDKFKRPHYHCLFFGLDFKDFEKLFRKTWHNGMIKSLPVLSGGVRYVVDYMTKAVNGDLAVQQFDNKGIERPFKLVSRGLGSELFFNHREEIRKEHILKIGSRVIPVPTYYRNMYHNYNDEEIISRHSFNMEQYQKIVKYAEKFGFSDVDSYLSYARQANERELLSRFRRKNIPVIASYKFIDKDYDVSILAQKSLL